MKARDIMTPQPAVVIGTEPVSRAAELMRDHDVGCIPVVSESGAQRLLGLITDRDIATRCVAKGHTPTCMVRDHMSGFPLTTAKADDDATDVVARMERAQVRRIPVVSGDGVLLGIIAQADIATRLGVLQPLKVEELLERVSAPAVAIV